VYVARVVRAIALPSRTMTYLAGLAPFGAPHFSVTVCAVTWVAFSDLGEASRRFLASRLI
jgi:hypothetical protein